MAEYTERRVMSMRSAATDPSSSAVRDALRTGIAALGGVAALFAGLAAGGTVSASVVGAAVAGVLASIAAAAIAHAIPRHHPHARVGWGNRVTLVRAAVVCALAGRAFEPASLTAGEAAVLGVIAACAALLDGFDGRLARAQGLTSAFGARFDLETDAALVAVAAILAVRAGLPLWALVIGALRYVHLGAGQLWPWLRAEVPDKSRTRRRRKAIGGMQGGVLIAALVGGPTPPARLAAAAALALLVYSFAADAVLLRRAHWQSCAVGAGADRVAV